VDRERIYNAPVFDYARIDEYSRPDYITNVYSYYGVSQGAVGAGVSGTSTTTGVSGGATGQAGATSGFFTLRAATTNDNQGIVTDPNTPAQVTLNGLSRRSR
jgi:tetrahydromethanopterin S-methyltransferase subunit D